MSITKTKIAKYAILPEVLPRAKDLLGTGFHFLASVIAVIYYNAGLLPAGHAYLNHNNYGKYGIRHVVAEAGNNLIFSRKHIDQIILYFTILVGLILLTLQLILLIISLLTHPAIASTAFYDMFAITADGPSQDMAFIVLDSVFGVMRYSGSSSAVGFFDSCISNLLVPCTDINGNIMPSPTTFPRPMHLALHQMLYFYTMGIAFIAGLIIIYFVISIIGETIVSGTPFGRRFNKAWFLPRLIVFFALLAPVAASSAGTGCSLGPLCILLPPAPTPVASGNNAGINFAQLITLSVAKFGSNMATNAWVEFNSAAVGATSALLGQEQSLIAKPNVPEIGTLSQFMHVVRMCMYAEKIINGIDVFPYIVRENNDHPDFSGMGGTADNHLDYFSTPFPTAVEFSRYGSVTVRFGHYNPPSGIPFSLNEPMDAYDDHWGYVKPNCGELVFQITSTDPYVIGDTSGVSAFIGIQENYYLSIEEYLLGDPVIDITSYCMLQAILPYGHDPSCVNLGYSGVVNVAGETIITPSTTQWLTVKSARENIEHYNALNKFYLRGETIGWGTYSYNPATDIFVDIQSAYDTAAYINNMIMPVEIRERGWAGAALWYNKIAELNGNMSSAMQNIPRPYLYPIVMEEIALQHKKTDANFSFVDRFNPRLQNGKLVNLPGAGDQYIAAALYSSYSFWQDSAVQETVFTNSTGNGILDVINMILGTQGLFDILENDGVHPLAMLSSLGKSMVDASLRNLFGGVLGQGLGELLDDNFLGKLGDTGGQFAFKFGMLGLSIGFILYYILPLMPFIYFFFAFSGWIKSIFEAVIAMPLWALAHIKIDGEGLPGPLATNGYFLLLEIFLRPTLIIFGFLASISLFAALVNVLHEVFPTLTLAVSGFDIEAEVFSPAVLSGGMQTIQFWRAPLDEFFYTIIYTILVYMIGLSCFKLIDQIPNNIMRWAGVTVSTFHETSGDPAKELSSKMFRAVQMTNAQILTMMDRARGVRGGPDRMTDTFVQTS